VAYDHNIKAGNAGDIFKHVALIAALRDLPAPASPVKFVDLFAGYAANPILPGREWQQGIGRVKAQCASTDNKDVNAYLSWYLSRPDLVGASYPGSSLIARDTLKDQGREIALTLYDIADGPVNSLRQVYGAEPHKVFHRAARPDEPEVTEADFLFIDPPGLASEAQPELPTFGDLFEFCDAAKQAYQMFWLPVTCGQSIESDLEQLFEQNFQVSVVVWGAEYATGTTQGCLIAYRSMDVEGQLRIRAALDEMHDLTGWDLERGAYIEHYVPA